MLARRLHRGHVGPALVTLHTLYNGTDVAMDYNIGLATSTDTGATWTKYGSNPVLPKGGVGTWDSGSVVQPALVWDGSQYVVYYAGYNGTYWQIGRATSPDLVTWTKYGSNPVLSKGTAGAFDDQAVNNPVVMLDGSTWRMWYSGWKSGGNVTQGYAESANGLSWTKYGQMLAEGAGGSFDVNGGEMGCVRKSGSTFYVYYAGLDGSSHYHQGLATTTTPQSAAAYTKQGVCPGLDGNVTYGGKTWQSNTLRSVYTRSDGSFIAFSAGFHPTDASGQETSFSVTSADGQTFSSVSGPLFALVPASWESNSAENPCAIAA